MSLGPSSSVHSTAVPSLAVLVETANTKAKLHGSRELKPTNCWRNLYVYGHFRIVIPQPRGKEAQNWSRLSVLVAFPGALYCLSDDGAWGVTATCAMPGTKSL